MPASHPFRDPPNMLATSTWIGDRSPRNGEDGFPETRREQVLQKVKLGLRTQFAAAGLRM